MIAPSILNADLLNLESDVQQVIKAGIRRLHIDIMDAHFVPNLSFGPELVSNLRKRFPKIEIEIHLMSDQPKLLIPAFVKAGANLVEFHYEALPRVAVNYWLQYLKTHGIKAGLAVSPGTDLTVLSDFIDQLDQVLLMTVHPGFGGQSFLSASPQRIKRAKEILRAKKSEVPIEVDGGINNETLPLAKQAGADIFVAGSYIFKKGKIPEQIALLRRLDQ